MKSSTLFALVSLGSTLPFLCGHADDSCSQCQAHAINTAAPEAAAQAWKEQWGIEVSSLRMSAAGYMIDFRYRVLDASKAGHLAKEENRPVLIDTATGQKMFVPRTKIGPMRQTAVNVTPGVIYTTLFANPAQVVKSGSKVDIVVGDCRLENLTVQ